MIFMTQLDIEQITYAAFDHYDRLRNAMIRHNINCERDVELQILDRIASLMLKDHPASFEARNQAMSHAVDRLIAVLDAAKNPAIDASKRQGLIETFTSFLANKNLEKLYEGRLNHLERFIAGVMTMESIHGDLAGEKSKDDRSITPAPRRKKA